MYFINWLSDQRHQNEERVSEETGEMQHMKTKSKRPQDITPGEHPVQNH